MTNEWTSREHAEAYLARMTDIPHRTEGEATLLSEIPTESKRVLDLGCGNGHLLGLVLSHCPGATGVGLDFSPTMLEESRRRFSDDDRVRFVEHNLDERLPDIGAFDCVISSFAIHHCADSRKRELYSEVFACLEAGAVFCNLEHVSSPSQRIHDGFVEAMGMTPEDEDPSNKLLDVETQLRWLREIGFEDVDCFWKWRELALLAGRRPTGEPNSVAGLDQIDDHPTPQDIASLDQKLEDFNARQTGRNDFEPLHLVIRNGQGELIAGIKGLTGWDWLYVQNLWVHEDLRHQGLGSRLLREAEKRAAKQGCRGSCLSSFSFQAPDFYRRHGYTVFGDIDEYPPGHTLQFLEKQL